MNKPKVVVHGDVPQDAIDAAQKMAEEMGIEEIHIGTPDQIENVLKDNDGLQMDGARLLTKDRNSGEINIQEEMTPDMAIRLAEMLGMDKEWAKIPYNGVEGDSCDCPACNARRKFDGPDLDMDAEKGIPPGRYSEKLAGVGKDVAGTPMMKLPGFESLKVKSRDEALKGLDDLLDVVRKKQDNHFKLCDKLADILTEVRRLVAEDRPFETIAKMKEVDELLSDLKK